MGVDSNFACRDCEVKCYLGYSSYANLLTHCKTVKEFDEQNSTDRPLSVNAAFREMLYSHEGHNWEVFSTDYTKYVGDDLWFEDPIDSTWDFLVFSNYKNYKDLTPKDRE